MLLAIMTSIDELYSLFKQHPVICTDTRHLSNDCLFFSLKGGNFNGNLFALNALENGAAYAVIDEVQESNDPRLLLVKDVLHTLQQLSSYHRKVLQIPVLAITGSNGKTTSKELVAAVLNKKYKTYYTYGNLNNHIGVPLTLLSLTKEHEFAVVEMGANHQQEIADLCSIADPDFGLITNIGKAHLEGFGGIEGVQKGKGELYDYLKAKKGLIFYQHENEKLIELLNGYSPTVSYGDNNNADFCGKAIDNAEYLNVEINKPFALNIKTQLTGNYNLDNVMSAVAIGTYFNVDAASIKNAIENYAPSNQRSQVMRKGNVTIVLDAYNANPSSMNAALTNFKNAFSGKKLLALGEMLELGEDSPSEHDKIAELADTIHAGITICVGKLFREPAKKYNFLHFENSTEASLWLKSNLPKEGTLLIKGSRGSKMEKLMDAFQEA